jgi:hypothetical protein
MTTFEPPRVSIKKLAPLFGVGLSGAYAAIAAGRFPIRTYQRSNGRFADSQDVDAYFEARKNEGLAALVSATP